MKSQFVFPPKVSNVAASLSQGGESPQKAGYASQVVEMAMEDLQNPISDAVK